MTPEEQILEWVCGKPIHNDERDECCPDFSCCQPELLVPFSVRRKFQEADEATRFGMLMQFLGAAFEAAAPDKKIHIAGEGQPQ